MICLDIHLKGEERERVEAIRERAVGRIPSRPRRRTLYLREQHRGSWLVGGEVGLLSEIAERQINGELLKVDGLFEGGVNVAAVVSPEELGRLRQDSSFTISDIVKIDVQ